MAKKSSASKKAAAKPVVSINVEMDDDSYGVDRDRLVLKCLRDIMRSLNIFRCDFKPLETNNGSSIFSFESTTKLSGIKQSNEEYITITKLKGSKKQPKNTVYYSVCVHLHRYPEFFEAIAPVDTEKARHISLSQRTSMWFAAPKLVDDEHYLSAEAFPEFARIAINKFLNDNPKAVMHFVYDPMLLAAGKKDKLLKETRRTYAERFSLIDVNAPDDFIYEESTVNEKIIYWLARYMLTLARSKDVQKRKSVNVVIVKDLLQLLTPVFTRGNIMDCVDNIMIYPDRADDPNQWECLQVEAPYLLNVVSKNRHDGEFRVGLGSDVMIPVFTSRERSIKNLDRQALLAFEKIRNVLLCRVLPLLDDEFLDYLQLALTAEAFGELSTAIHLIKEQAKDDGQLTILQRTFLENLFLFETTAFNPHDMQKIVDIVKQDHFTGSFISYANLFRLCHDLTFNQWQSTVQCLHREVAAFARHHERKSVICDEAAFKAAIYDTSKKFVLDSTGPAVWQSALQLGSNWPTFSYSTAMLAKPPNTPIKPLASIIWSASNTNSPISYLMLLLVDPVALQLIRRGSNAWLLHKKDSQSGSVQAYPVNKANVREKIQQVFQYVSAAKNQSQLDEYDDEIMQIVSNLLDFALEMEQQKDEEGKFLIVFSAKEIIKTLKKGPDVILVPLFNQLMSLLSKTVHYFANPAQYQQKRPDQFKYSSPDSLLSSLTQRQTLLEEAMFDHGASDSVKTSYQNLTKAVSRLASLVHNSAAGQAIALPDAGLVAAASQHATPAAFGELFRANERAQSQQIVACHDEATLRSIITECDQEIENFTTWMRDPDAYAAHLLQRGQHAIDSRVAAAGSLERAAVRDCMPKLEKSKREKALAEQRLREIADQASSALLQFKK